MSVIATQGLTKKFGELVAVDSLDLEIPKGGVVGFVGPNGSGKSTTIRMLLGLITPDLGRGAGAGGVHIQARQVRAAGGCAHRESLVRAQSVRLGESQEPGGPAGPSGVAGGRGHSDGRSEPGGSATWSRPTPWA